MENEDLDNKEKYERVSWMITTLDARRASLESRSATVLSADALLFAGVMILIDNMDGISSLTVFLKILFIICVVAVFVLLAFSLASATIAIANVNNTSRKMFGDNCPSRLFFYPRETFESFKNFDRYAEGFYKTTDREFINYMLGELWVLSQEYHRRYQNLRWSIRLLIYSITPFIVLIGISIGKTIF